MTNASSEVQRSARKNVPVLDARIPPGVRWLAYLSTNRWQPHPPVHPAVARMVTALETEDWMIRGAWARNYLLWRNGRTMREARLPLLILPLVFGRLSDIQINVFLTLEVIEAKFRLWRGPDREYAPDAAAEIQAMVSLIGDETGTIVADPFRLHREALHWLERMTH